MKTATTHQAVSTTAHAINLNSLSMKQLIVMIGQLLVRYERLQIFSQHSIYFIVWFISGVGLFLIGSIWILSKIFHFSFSHHFYERITFKGKSLDRARAASLCLEVAVPKSSQATAFQVQQKILKTVHSVYHDPIEGISAATPNWYFFRKLYRGIKVYMSRKVFFTMQIYGRYPDISFRLTIPRAYYDRIEKAVYGAYPGAEISVVENGTVQQEIAKYPDSFLSYGQSTIEGDFYHRIKSFRDFSSDPVDSMIAAMEGLKVGQFMVYTITLAPVSHFFNQLIHHLLEEEERNQQGVFDRRLGLRQMDPEAPDLRSQRRTAMIEKMKAPLFQIVLSYWTVMPTAEASEAKLRNIQSVLMQLNQKNMNTLKHKRLFTKRISDLQQKGKLERITALRPVLRRPNIPFLPFIYRNRGQLVSDSELYSLWHLPNLTAETTASVKVNKFKKLPASHAMRAFAHDHFVTLGTSNFKMHEDSRVGIPIWDDMKKHVYILGGTGSGKSETLKTILHNILEKQEKIACLIIDPKNDFATDLLPMIPEGKKDDVVYFNPPKQRDRPLSFPFFSRFSGEKTDDERIEFLISIMRRFVQIDSAYAWGPELENILRQLFATAYCLPEQSLSGLDLLMHDPGQIKSVNNFLPPRIQNFWTSSILNRTNNDLAKYLATTNNKIGKFLDYPEFMNVVDRTEAKITFEEMIQTGKIFIANLGSCSEQMKKYYSVYLAAHIAEAVFGQAGLPVRERKPAVFAIDEFQRVASDIFETLFSEVRAFNTALVISNQFMGQLDERIKKSIESNIATKIFMRTQSVDDAEIAEKILGGKVTVEDIINLPTGSAYVKTLVDGIPQEAMSMHIKRAPQPSVNTEDIEKLYIRHTMERYGTPLGEITERRKQMNALYYTAAQPAEFYKQMDIYRRKQDEPRETKELETVAAASEAS